MSDNHGPFDQIVNEIRAQAPPAAQLVFVSGNFNILHPGHLRLLRFARECGDFLVAAVQDDELAGEAALISEALRLEGLRSNSWVDYAFILRHRPEEFIGALKPSIVVKGKEHENADNLEHDAVAQYGGRLLFGSGETVFSSVDLLRREGLQPRSSRLLLPEDYAQRHGFTHTDLRGLIKKFSEIRIVVIGDLIVDEYVECEPLGMSQEDPTIVVTPVYEQSYVGGAGIVAAHAATLGARVDYFAVAGRDASREVASSRLNEYGVVSHLVEDESRPTTLKKRFRARNKTLLRVSYLRQHGLSGDLQADLVERLGPALDQADVLAFSDFNYGCLPQPLVETLTQMGRERGILMVADSQCSSQIGDVSRFRGMHLLTPTEREARISTHNQEDGLVVLAEKLGRQAEAQNLFVKLGSEGLLIHADVSESSQWHTDRLPAFSLSAQDTAGAGDSMLAASALCLAAGAPIWQAAYLGSVAAACQVDRLGNVPIQASELLAALNGDA
jgi:rfaE bifunctional protein kinase chain/domain